MPQTNEKSVPVQPNDQALHFATHPGVKAIVIPLWMIEKIQVDLYTAPQELVVQLVEEGSVEGKEDEAN